MYLLVLAAEIRALSIQVTPEFWTRARPAKIQTRLITEELAQ
jgi:hypothetical protein